MDQHPELPDRERAYAAIEIAATWLSLPHATPATNTLDGVRLYEARAGKGYYAAWQGLTLRTDRAAVKQWPPSWHTITQRKSVLTRWLSPKHAVNPAHAMLNFAYSLLESQTRQALNAIGADLVCGVLHSDRYGRESLVFDIMEPLRGLVDTMFLTFLQEHTFSAADFGMQTNGAVTIHPSLCRVLAEMVRVPQRKADDEARWFRTQLVDMRGRVDRRKPRYTVTADDGEDEEE